ncbi:MULTISPECIES: EAL domain-containing protein [Rubrivivax]|uniref:EAL domain-containing protein n=2 Tax=Rubrivivax benzoatilyticus TaxID=316997 RepID=A0ABX0HSS9_9BURK|nr:MULTISPECIES: EAL domain-containing protein [Rubrivivax]MCC9598899.1 EAL domain-containing protein [Rubrivivax sp. JA1055]NHK97315.1 EAL domain-containing protein [Rubrivivax benzoatilyticus]NHL22990.1 EAL domain-containing protein [Rubrivivax benzoatilyticus]
MPEAMATPPFSYAFQPIIDAVERRVVSYEALVRGPGGEPAAEVLGRVPEAQLAAFDRLSRAHALALAAQLGLPCLLNLNLLPHGLLADGDAIDATLRAARDAGLPPERLVFEITESDAIADRAAFAALVNRHKSDGLLLAIDDFGAGQSGLNLLADFQPDMIKVDRHLIHGVDAHGPRQAILRGLLLTCELLGIDVVAEGVESAADYRWLRARGVRLFQGYLFARPGFETLPQPTLPEG